MTRLKEKGGVAWLLKALKTDPEKGIPSSGVELRRKAFGSNKVSKCLIHTILLMDFGSCFVSGAFLVFPVGGASA